MREEKRVSIGKIILITATVTVAMVTIFTVMYKLFKKYFKVTFDCGECDGCADSCFGDGFDPLCDEDFAPKCALDDEEEDDEEDDEDDE